MQTGTSLLFNLVLLIGGIWVLVMLAWNLRLHYLNALYLKAIPWVVLEIVPPRDVFKSPEAMELVLNSLHGGGFGNWYERYWKGELAQYYSLEIASIEGRVRFFVRFHKKFRKVFEAQFYAQYPQAQVMEAEDYTKGVPEYTKGGSINLFGYTLSLNSKKDESYPIKTYVDYGLDRAIGSLDEEQRIDPLTPLLETMGSIGIGEQIWVQYIIRQDVKRHSIKKKKDGKEIEEQGKSWKEKSREAIAKIKESANTKDDDGKVTQGRLTKGEQQLIDAIERHRNKQGFDTGIRCVYVADKEHFSGDTITAFTSMFRQFNSEDMNNFAMEGLTKIDVPWNDLRGVVVDKKKEGMLKAYKGRAFFYKGFDFSDISRWFSHPEKLGANGTLFSTEELATLFHLPGRVAETPTVTRIEATKGEPPANLPI
ncbi:hypothetical protein IT401_02810 [Candidatus Nomurabacteria bacterium]|nr:hypothetical protein [Candidatus Nomurabacteria bacterium]